jgi:hypothetical protein
MRPDQCGSAGRPLTGGDLRVVRDFEAFLRTRAAATHHQATIAAIMHAPARPQLVSGPPYHVADLVKVVEDGDFVGRWGQVVAIEDYRHLHVVGADNSRRLSFLIMVSLLTRRPGRGLVAYPPGPVPFEPVELAPLHEGAGDWTKGGRVVSRRNWPRSRDGVSA